ncbi:MAG: hypothetical protein JSS29_04925 [Proteobacteria bacterium]|nr:hypothetical protein [Pseudomonadota bacterium]
MESQPPYQLQLIAEPHYLHAIVTGPNDARTVARYLEELRSACVARGARRVLIEERLTGPRLGTLTVYQVISQASERARGVLSALAFVDLEADSSALTGFATDVAANRGIPVAAFASVAEARAWLLKAPDQAPTAV